MTSPAQRRTVKIRVRRRNRGLEAYLVPASTPIGATTGVYAIENVPPHISDDVTLKLAFGSGLLDPDAEYPQWTYTWASFEHLEGYTYDDDINELDDD